MGTLNGGINVKTGPKGSGGGSKTNPWRTFPLGAFVQAAPQPGIVAPSPPLGRPLPACFTGQGLDSNVTFLERLSQSSQIRSEPSPPLMLSLSL